MTAEIRYDPGLCIGEDGLIAACFHACAARCTAVSDVSLTIFYFHGVVGAGPRTTAAPVTKIDFNPDCHDYLVMFMSLAYRSYFPQEMPVFFSHDASAPGTQISLFSLKRATRFCTIVDRATFQEFALTLEFGSKGSHDLSERPVQTDLGGGYPMSAAFQI